MRAQHHVQEVAEREVRDAHACGGSGSDKVPEILVNSDGFFTSQEWCANGTPLRDRNRLTLRARVLYRCTLNDNAAIMMR